MQRVKRSTAVAVLPAAPGGGTPGFFAQPNPGGGVPATVPGYEWFNGVQEEIMAVIEGAGLSGSSSDNTLMRQAIGKMIQGGQRAVVVSGVTFAPSVTGAGKAVYWDSGNSRFDLAQADGTAKQNIIGFADVPNASVYCFGDAVLFTGLTSGSRYYLDSSTAGSITTVPGTVFVGIAKGSTELFVDIDSAVAAVVGYMTSCRVATVGANITLAGSAPNTLDGITLVAGDRILVKDQTTPSQNGIYTVATLGTGANGTWTRAADADQAGELIAGAVVPVNEGTLNADTLWMLVTDGTITIGSTSLTFNRKDSASPGSIKGNFSNLQASATGASANVSITADEIALEDAGGNYVTARSVNVTINMAGAGANGLDTGVLAANTWYATYVIRKPDGTTAGLASLSATTPTMPSGYTFKSRSGWVRTDGTGNKYPLGFKQFGADVQYLVGAGNVSVMPLMSSGAQGSITTPTYVAVGVSNFVPPTASRIRGNAQTESSYVMMVAPNNSFGAYTSATNQAPFMYNPVSVWSHLFDFALESNNIYWANNGGGRLSCFGWRDNF